MKDLLNGLGTTLFLLSLVLVPISLVTGLITLINGNKKGRRIALIMLLSAVASFILSISFCSMGGFAL